MTHLTPIKQQETLTMGAVGEKIVLDHLVNKMKINARPVDNWFDSTCDIIIEDNLKMEVKFQHPVYSQNCFTVREHQFRKCNNALVAFGCVPKKFHSSSADGGVWTVEGREFDKFEVTTEFSHRIPMVKVPFEAARFWFWLTDEEIAYLQTLTQSNE